VGLVGLRGRRALAAAMLDVTVEQNKEAWDVGEDDDEGHERVKYEVLECPRICECSKEAFKRGHVWSYESAEKCRSYLAWHLHKSSKHYLDRDEAVGEAYVADVQETIETQSDRQQQREEYKDEQVKQQAKVASHREQRAHRVPATPRSRSPRRIGAAGSKGNGRMPIGASASSATTPVQTEVSEMAKAVKDAAKSMQEVANMQQQLLQNSPADKGAASSSSALARTPGRVLMVDKIEVPINHLNVLHQSLKEVRDAMNKLVCLMPVLDASERAIAQLIRN